MTTDPNRSLTPPTVLLTVALCFIFGANPTAIKISLTGIGKFTVAGIRFAMAAIVHRGMGQTDAQAVQAVRRGIRPNCRHQRPFRPPVNLFLHRHCQNLRIAGVP